MILSQYFVEFIFYSFLGWVWESLYCTIREKAWQDRGFLFGPICPIYGASVVAVMILSRFVPQIASGAMPAWGIFLICMAGSAVAEYATSWVLEKRFHMRWWDYSDMPLNLNGRICLPASIGFGAAGIVVVRWLIPLVQSMHGTVHPMLYEGLALILAAGFGADFALTEASLSHLIRDMKAFRDEFNARAEAAYETLSGVGIRYASALTGGQKKILRNVRKFTTPIHSGGLTTGEHLRNALRELENRKDA